MFASWVFTALRVTRFRGIVSCWDWSMISLAALGPSSSNANITLFPRSFNSNWIKSFFSLHSAIRKAKSPKGRICALNTHLFVSVCSAKYARSLLLIIHLKCYRKNDSHFNWFNAHDKQAAVWRQVFGETVNLTAKSRHMRLLVIPISSSSLSCNVSLFTATGEKDGKTATQIE